MSYLREHLLNRGNDLAMVQTSAICTCLLAKQLIRFKKYKNKIRRCNFEAKKIIVIRKNHFAYDNYTQLEYLKQIFYFNRLSKVLINEIESLLSR